MKLRSGNAVLIFRCAEVRQPARIAGPRRTIMRIQVDIGAFPWAGQILEPSGCRSSPSFQFASISARVSQSQDFSVAKGSEAEFAVALIYVVLLPQRSQIRSLYICTFQTVYAMQVDHATCLLCIRASNSVKEMKTLLTLVDAVALQTRFEFSVVSE